MLRNFTLEYWRDDGWFVGRLKELPGYSAMEKRWRSLEENIRDAYGIMIEPQEQAESGHP
jgi:hypothetical protein